MGRVCQRVASGRVGRDSSSGSNIQYFYAIDFQSCAPILGNELENVAQGQSPFAYPIKWWHWWGGIGYIQSGSIVRMIDNVAKVTL